MVRGFRDQMTQVGNETNNEHGTYYATSCIPRVKYVSDLQIYIIEITSSLIVSFSA